MGAAAPSRVRVSEADGLLGAAVEAARMAGEMLRTRSAEGSEVPMALASLFGTWLAQGRDPFAACQQLLLTDRL